jgi:hypothetical protein
MKKDYAHIRGNFINSTHVFKNKFMPKDFMPNEHIQLTSQQLTNIAKEPNLSNNRVEKKKIHAY